MNAEGAGVPAPGVAAGTASAVDPARLAEPALTQLAAGGDVAAQRELAGRLHAGRGRPRDLRSAVVWYRRAAEAGDAEAQFQLGNLYLMGEGIEADDAWAITWFRRAAGQGHAKAQAHLENLLKLSGGRP
jgi:TPR repeat protein